MAIFFNTGHKKCNFLVGIQQDYLLYSMRFFYIILAFIIGNSWVWAQEDNKFTKPLHTKTPTQKKDTAKSPPTEVKKTQEKRYPGFNPERMPSLISEDTLEIDNGEPSVVEITEEVQVDSSWIQIAGYYAVWDSRTVDPYGIDPKDFSDSVEILLYDPIQNLNWASPLQESRVNSNFGFRGYRWHYGTDLDLNIGDSIRASFDGIIRIVRYDGQGWGNFVLIRHYNGLETLYGHLSKQLVHVGQLIKAGEVIGLGGNTGRSSGPHLHYEVRYQGNPFNAGLVYNFDVNQIKSQYFMLVPNHFSYTTTHKAVTVRKLVYYRVRKGDSLGTIASRHGTTVTKLRKLNRLGRTIVPGQKIRIR